MRQTCLFGDVLEGSVAHVAEQDVAPACGSHEQIEATVVVIVDEGGSHANAREHAHAGLFRDIFEGAVALVAVEGTGPELVDEIDIVQAVAIEIADRDAAAVVVEVDLESLSLFVAEELHLPGDADLGGALAKTLRHRG
jgi:hypothetical protein